MPGKCRTKRFGGVRAFCLKVANGCRPTTRVADQLLQVPLTSKHEVRCAELLEGEPDGAVTLIYQLALRWPILTDYLLVVILQNSIEGSIFQHRIGIYAGHQHASAHQ